MICGVEVFRRVPVLGLVATADVATCEAEAQVYPGVTHFEALLAAVATGRHITDRPKMGADRFHAVGPPSCTATADDAMFRDGASLARVVPVAAVRPSWPPIHNVCRHPPVASGRA